jgi:DNA-binding CsgD family transcriptional regulator
MGWGRKGGNPPIAPNEGTSYGIAIHVVLDAMMTDEAHNSPILSKRERQCLTYLAQGLRVIDLADAIGIKPKTAEKQIASARAKLGAATREQAVAIAIRNNLL